MGFPLITVMKCLSPREHTDPFMKEIYRDVSKPEGRQAWLPQFTDEMYEYSVAAIHEIDSMFCEAIQSTDDHIELLNIMEDVRSCERLHPTIKENLCHNIRIKL